MIIAIHTDICQILSQQIYSDINFSKEKKKEKHLPCTVPKPSLDYLVKSYSIHKHYEKDVRGEVLSFSTSSCTMIAHKIFNTLPHRNK